MRLFDLVGVSGQSGRRRPHRMCAQKAALQNIASFPAHNKKSCNKKSRPIHSRRISSMTEPVEYFSAPCAPPDSSPALENAAVAHCCEVWELTRRQAREAGNSTISPGLRPTRPFKSPCRLSPDGKTSRTSSPASAKACSSAQYRARMARGCCMPLRSQWPLPTAWRRNQRPAGNDPIVSPPKRHPHPPPM